MKTYGSYDILLKKGNEFDEVSCNLCNILAVRSSYGSSYNIIVKVTCDVNTDMPGS